MKVKFEYLFPKALSNGAKKAIKRAASATVQSLPKNATRLLVKKVTYSLSLSVVADPHMKKLNRVYRGKNRTTDVLSFSQLEGLAFPSARRQVGDVILSLPQAKRQARKFGASLEDELARLTIHGVLHLFGYDHEKSKAEERRMFRLQDRIFSQL